MALHTSLTTSWTEQQPIGVGFGHSPPADGGKARVLFCHAARFVSGQGALPSHRHEDPHGGPPPAAASSRTIPLLSCHRPRTSPGTPCDCPFTLHGSRCGGPDRVLSSTFCARETGQLASYSRSPALS